MIARLLALTALALVISGVLLTTRPIPSQAQDGADRDAVILLDYTRSMIGEGTGNPDDIWEAVLENVQKRVDSFADGIDLAIVPFADGPRLNRVWPQDVASREDDLVFLSLDDESRGLALDYLGQLPEPDGQATWICDAMEYALAQLQERRSGSVDRVQHIYLYTDGLDNGTCRRDFPSQLVDLFNGARGDYPYLYTVYIDLAGSLSEDDASEIEDGTGGHIDHSEGIPAIVTVEPNRIDLGNLFGHEQGEFELQFDNLPAGEVLAAAVQVPDNFGLSVEPSQFELAGRVTYVVRPSNPEVGEHVDVLQLQRTAGNYIFDDASVAVSYAWKPPATPTPSPTIAPSPTPAPTPAPLVTVITDPPPGSVGSISVGETLVGDVQLSLRFNESAELSDGYAAFEALVDGTRDAELFGFVGMDGSLVDEIAVRSDSPEVVAAYALAHANDALLPGSSDHLLEIRPIDGSLPTVGANGEAFDSLDWRVQTVTPLGPLHIAFLIGLLAALLLLLYVLFHPRFPRDAEMVVQGGERHHLRSMAEKSLRGRLFGRSLSVGDPNQEIDVGADGRVGTFRAARMPVGLFGGSVYFRSEAGQEPPPTVDGEVVGGTVRIHPGSTISLGPSTLTYELAEVYDDSVYASDLEE